jgi:hypothetical protein
MLDISVAEMLGLALVLGGLGLSLWSIVDDLWDLVHVYRFGEVNGPRWVAAMEHFLTSLAFFGAWTAILGILAIAIYLPPRASPAAAEMAGWAGWLRVGSVTCFLVAQVNRRVGRIKMRQLPVEAWQRMIEAMLDGLTAAERASLSHRLLVATTAGRELGHAVSSAAQVPVAVLDEIARDESLTAERRAAAREALAAIDHMLTLTRGLHAQIKAQSP